MCPRGELCTSPPLTPLNSRCSEVASTSKDRECSRTCTDQLASDPLIKSRLQDLPIDVVMWRELVFAHVKYSQSVWRVSGCDTAVCDVSVVSGASRARWWVDATVNSARSGAVRVILDGWVAGASGASRAR